MVEVNKFHEEREGCKSVLHKHKFANLSSVGKSFALMQDNR